MSKVVKKVWGSIKEFVRKKMVALKRKPSTIIFIILLICMLQYTLSMTDISNTTAKANRSNMGITAFATTLCSILVLIAMLNAFPRRKKPRIFMIAVTCLLIAVMVVCDIVYIGGINQAINDPKAPLSVADNPYVLSAKSTVLWHVILLGVALLSVVSLPVYSKLLQKINTSVHIEDDISVAEDAIIESINE